MKQITKLILTMATTLVVMMSGTLVAFAAGMQFEIGGQIGTPAYHIVYDANGGEGGSTGLSILSGGTDTVLSSGQAGVTRDGYAFVGWNTQPGGSGVHYVAGDSVVLADGNLVLYAQWREIVSGGGAGGVTVAGGSPGGSSDGAGSKFAKTGDLNGVGVLLTVTLITLCVLLVAVWRMQDRKYGDHCRKA